MTEPQPSFYSKIEQLPALVFVVKWLLLSLIVGVLAGSASAFFSGIIELGDRLARIASVDYLVAARWWIYCGRGVPLLGSGCGERQQSID